MKSMTTLAALSAVALLISASPAIAGVPQLMNYQGYLTDNNGDPLNGNFQLVFTIYDAAVAGNIEWQETHPVVTVTDGFFSVLLGSNTPVTDVVFAETERWLGITVGTYGVDPEQTPRTRLVTVPYAFRISTVDSATGGTITSQVIIYDNDATTNTGGLGLEYAGGIGGTFTLANGRPHLMSGAGQQLRISTLDGSGQAIVIDNRDVGVGTTSPAAKLHDSGSIYTVGGNGDANLSGGTDAADLTLMVNYLTQNSFLTEGGFAEADLDGDGRVTWDDVAILERIIFQAETREQAWRLIHSLYGAYPATGGNAFYVRGQVGIGTNSPQGALDVSSTTGGLIVPRMTTAERNALTAVNGMIIYNTTDNQFNFYENGAWVTN